MGLSEGRVAANGIEFAYLEIGTGPLALCLHGFPDSPYTYRHLMPALAAAGYRAVAPFMRGYAPTDVAPDDDYSIGALARDAAAQRDALGGDKRSALIGHDWGAATAHAMRPGSFARVVALAVPPLHAFAKLPPGLRPRQARRSWYMALFQLPWLPEVLGPKVFPQRDDPAYREAWSQPGALTAMLNWYRYIPLSGRAADERRITLPVLVVWGDRDSALEPGLAEESASLCDTVEVVHLPEATHWLQHEEVDRVNALLLEFLRPQRAVRQTSAATT